MKTAKRLPDFVGYFNSNLAREVARLTDWTAKIWERRYQAIVITTRRRRKPLTGTWHDRTQEYVARRRRGEDPDPLKYTTSETVTFSPLPCWSHLSPEAYRQRVGTMATEIEEDAAAARKRTGAQPLGAAKILAQDPWTRPERVKKSPAPLLHAASKAMRQVFYEGFALFVAAYRTAAEKLRRGDPAPGFPFGSFPPALPFVGG